MTMPRLLLPAVALVVASTLSGCVASQEPAISIAEACNRFRAAAGEYSDNAGTPSATSASLSQSSEAMMVYAEELQSIGAGLESTDQLLSERFSGAGDSFGEAARDMRQVAEGDLDVEDAAPINSDDVGALSDTCSENGA